MREIKFRAWYSDENRMEYQDNKTPVWVGDILTDSYYTPLQYIGLKDKNGKEIYEGDIMKGGISYSWRKTEMGIVEFGLFESDNSGDEYGANEVCGWNIKPIKLTEEDDVVNGQFIWKELEIIGNIYENPELLKEKS